jgi:hypothetical protein
MKIYQHYLMLKLNITKFLELKKKMKYLDKLDHLINLYYLVNLLIFNQNPMEYQLMML